MASDNEVEKPCLTQTTPSVRFLWKPQGLGEKILGMTSFRGMPVFATTDGVYVITTGEPLSDWVIEKIKVGG